MDLSRLHPVGDVSVGAWIAPRLRPFGPAVGSIVPREYEGYARVLHPAARADDALVRWTDVCATTGHEPHALMRWEDVAGVISARVDRTLVASAWLGPEEGNLHPVPLRHLCRLLKARTSTADRCFFALWDGHDWIPRSPSASIFRPQGRRSRRLRRPHVWRRPTRAAPDGTLLTPPHITRWRARRLEIPGRGYLLFSGSLDAVTAMGWQAADDRFWPQSPNLFWPDDHAWCVGTEVDRRSTVVGGSASLIASIIGEIELEAWPVNPDDWVD